MVIIACGPLVGQALEAGRLLREQNIAATVITNPFVNRVDVETIGAGGAAMCGAHCHHRRPSGRSAGWARRWRTRWRRRASRTG